MRILALLALCFAAVPAIPSNPQRIVGGSVATISQYPTIAAVLRLNLGLYSQVCGGTILNSRSILTAAHCTINEIYGNTRIRVGSTWANSGGVVHNVNGHIVHPSYDVRFLDYDIAILRSATTIYFDNNVRVASIAGPNYNLTDDQAVWAAGWGVTYVGDSGSEHLRHVELMAVNQTICRNNYAQLTRISITDNMVCAGWPSGGRDQCSGDAGGPLYHNDVVVGVYSFGGCNWDLLFSVNARVSRFASWIQSNA